MAQENKSKIRQLVAATIFVGGALAVGGGAAAQEGRFPSGTALAGVNVIDVKSGRIARNKTVVFAGNTIVAVQDASVPLEPDVEVVPMNGKYVIPGLWDMHVHVVDESYLELFAANGVTGVRDMGGGLDQPGDGCESLKPAILQKWRSEVTAGQRVGPELVVSGPAVSGTGWPTSLPARTPDEARAAVQSLMGQRVDFLKVYEKVPLGAYNVLATQAERRGLPFAGHVPEEVGPLRAILAGQRSIEHIRDAMLVCFTADPAELGRFFVEDQWSETDRKWGLQAHASCPSIIAALQTNEVWLTPTLTVEKAKVSFEDRRHVSDARRRLLPRPVLEGYSVYVGKKTAQSPADRASERLWWRTQQKLVHRMKREGVKMLAGTDSACEGGLPGYTLHVELMELVAAGLSPLEALRTATVEAARYLGRAHEGGVVPGFRANMLILDANPLTDIENTQRIDSVVLRGRLMRRAGLKLSHQQRKIPR